MMGNKELGKGIVLLVSVPLRGNVNNDRILGYQNSRGKISVSVPLRGNVNNDCNARIDELESIEFPSPYGEM